MTQAAHLSHSQLVVRRFLRHRLGIFGAIMTFLIYFVAAFVEFLAPHTPGAYQARDVYAPPQDIRWMLESPDGRRFQPHVYGLRSTTDYNTGQRIFEEDLDRVIELGFFVRGEGYKFWGLVPSNLHFIGPKDPGERVYFFGADRLGRDVLSRTIYATRVSMTIGLVGVGLSVILGIAIGGVSGYFGGIVDLAIQRLIEFLQSLPSIPLWIGLAAAIPPTTPPIRTYFFITAILSIIGWTGLARVVRGRFMSLKDEDFIKSARLDGNRPVRIIRRHMVPNFLSHIIAVVTLAIPGMIIAETSLSFLGIGLRPPVVSWGVLLQEAQNLRSIATAPWLFLPGAAVVVAVLSLNFLGDGLRDAADPYAN
ncbi:MAG: ABC transporter permease subunit [Albidovulum sp.]|nr:ABC transporter permease subunit [Albidovulum sp.]MDE0305576.1 ABC transporter permease subunit [Albidovulum sp.]MDE0534446.1 ABC transporter permease subunit [Albidovulum sp.]